VGQVHAEALRQRVARNAPRLDLLYNQLVQRHALLQLLL
jgi:hypothetical protein